MLQRLGLETNQVRSDLSPESKAESVAELGRDRTLMVGDGLNDAFNPKLRGR